MENPRIFTANSEAEIWQQVTADMALQGEIYEYSAQLNQGKQQILLDIDIDLGGGFESGFESTTLTARVSDDVALRFAIHEQDWVSELGKLLGLEDIEIGYPDFDEAFIIKTNEPATLHTLFADGNLRAILLNHKGFELTLAPETHHSETDIVLRFSKDEGIVEAADLQQLYHLMYALLERLNP
ncbi:hypothetical protein [Hymenobacter jejuensis]|uniref:Uncharacterized protein n=1 Tax=Hymenobacter jejuensis TaxID=2502781 RepID=A0A5B7ZXK3_9BACT|nr:hypothetical protein [Hymenobacter jejuensis]QDA59529.1 hypothetical protein FHG12_05150 [Hymenobacter jejuensis]